MTWAGSQINRADDLLGAGDGLPMVTDAAGIYLFPESFETIISMLGRGIAALTAGEPFRRLATPPVIARSTVERAGYVASFPQLVGTVHSYTGNSRTWATVAPLVAGGGPWHAHQDISDVVLLPAACYPIYPMLAGRGLDAPVSFALDATCFRQEATSEPGRLRSFRVAELVTAGTDEHCVRWRDRWLSRATGWLSELGLDVRAELADDPFFGPGRKLYQEAQRLQELKFELRAPVAGDLWQAIASVNYHKEHFGEAFEFTAGGSAAHTACTGFGLERVALALINVHGPAPRRWPAGVLAALDPTEAAQS